MGLSLNAGVIGNLDSDREGVSRWMGDGRDGISKCGCGLFPDSDGMVFGSRVPIAGLIGSRDSNRKETR